MAARRHVRASCASRSRGNDRPLRRYAPTINFSLARTRYQVRRMRAGFHARSHARKTYRSRSILINEACGKYARLFCNLPIANSPPPASQSLRYLLPLAYAKSFAIPSDRGNPSQPLHRVRLLITSLLRICATTTTTTCRQASHDVEHIISATPKRVCGKKFTIFRRGAYVRSSIM